MDNLFNLSGKVAIVTGSSRGIGEAIAKRMAQHGAKVVVSSRKPEACEEVAKEINETSGNGKEVATVIACNIAEKAQLQALIDKTIEKWGRLDILVCNAAVNPFYGFSRDIPDEAFDKVLDCNVRSNHWLCHMAAPHMIKQSGGSIIIISSIGGLRGSLMLGTYSISKAADIALARNLAREYGEQNIRANCILPGLIKTYFAKALWENPETLARTTSTSALKRIGEPDEIAGAAVFLASPAGAFTTGASVVIDGGVVC
jgi:NAD(P)-dependent dehydrogenase (short-subunit alcohol dehydrogenase family)